MTSTVAVPTPDLDMPAGSAVQRDGCRELASELRRFDHVFAVPGYPVSHLLDSVVAGGGTVVWSVNEKNAVESAVGAALAGDSAAVVIKHNGLGVAVDSLSNAVVHGVSAPLVVIVGDDVDAGSSTSYMDSRVLGAAAGMITLSPSLVDDIRDVVELAVGASLRTGAPVMVRITGRLHGQCEVSGTIPAIGAPFPQGEIPQHTHRLTKLARIVRSHATRDDVYRDMDDAGLDFLKCDAQHGPLVVGVGDVELPSMSGICVARVRSDHPSGAIRAAAAAHERVIVVEEGDPVVESQLEDAARVGLSLLPRIGRVTPSMVRAAVLGQPSPEPELSERHPDGPASDAALFTAVGRLRAEGTFVATDVGSSVALSYPPFNGADSALALGSSPAVAAGAARAGRTSIAVLGDFGLLHSGITGLIEIAGAALPVVSIVLENGIQAKTGKQPLPPVDLDGLLADGVLCRVVIWDEGLDDAELLYERLKIELSLVLPLIIRFQRRAA